MADTGGVVAGGLCINTDVWKKIPKDLQKALLDLRHDYGIRYAQQTMDLEAVLCKEVANQAWGQISISDRGGSENHRRLPV